MNKAIFVKIILHDKLRVICLGERTKASAYPVNKGHWSKKEGRGRLYFYGETVLTKTF